MSQALYGLRQASRLWHQHFHASLTSIEFIKTHADIPLYTKRSGESLTIIVVYVDDLLLTSSNKDSIAKVQQDINAKYKARVGFGKSEFLEMVIGDTENSIFILNKGAIQNFYNILVWTSATPQLSHYLVGLEV